MILAADSEGPDQTAHTRSLIRAFALRACPEGTFSLGAAPLSPGRSSLMPIPSILF